MHSFDDIVTPEQLVELIQSTKPKQNDEPKNLRYAIYIRKSTDDADKQVRSLEDQLAECQKLARDLGIVVLKENIIEESETAKIAGVRPKFRKLLNRIIAGELDGVIAWHPNRLSRNMLEAGEIIDLLDRSVIKDLKFPSHTFVNDASGKMLLGIVFVMAKQYSEQLSADIKRGNDKSVEAGLYINKPKHGYIKDNNQRLQPDGNNWAIIKEAFQMKMKGKSLETIAKFVRNSGYYSRGKDNVRRDVKVSLSMLGTIFSDPIYAGVLQYGKNVVNLTELYDFTPIISVQEYLQINQFKSLAQAFKPRKHARGDETRVADFLPRQVYCHHCGGLMQAGVSQGKTKKYYYFRCETRDCKRYNKGTRGSVLLNFVDTFLRSKPFASKKMYESYKQGIIRIQNLGLSEINSQIASATKQASLYGDDIASIKLNLSKETDTGTKQIQKDELKRLEGVLLETQTLAEELKAKKTKVSKAPLTFSEFSEIMDAIPDKIKEVQSTTEKHAYVAPIFLNFSVSKKKVENYTLKQPFKGLFSEKLSECGDDGN
jgi:site-specific DNA recombinase